MTTRPNSDRFSLPARAVLGAAIACSSAAAGVPADPPVYRCGDSYSSQRCGQALPLDVGDPRSADERAQGQDVTRRERHLADALAAERHARDAAPPARPSHAKATCAASSPGRCASRSPRPRRAHAGDHAASGTMVARVPAVPKAGGH